MAAAKLCFEVTCSICTDIYTSPVTLTCGHSFCHDCISKTFDNQYDREYFCPECMHGFWKRPVLQKNLRLAGIAEYVHSEGLKKEKPEKNCSYCVSSPVPAVSLCLHCEAFLCDVHKQTHNKSPEHVLTDPTTSLEKRKCPVHKKVMEYYCTVDDMHVCVQCLTSDHNGHKVSTISEFLQQQTKNLGTILEKLSLKKEKTEANLQSLQDRKMKLDKNADALTERVTVIMEDIGKQQKDLEKKVQGEISKQKQTISQLLYKRIQQLETDKSELHEKIVEIKELNDSSNPSSTLQGAEDLLDVSSNEDNLDRGKHGKVIDDAGDLEEGAILTILYSGLSNIAMGAERDTFVKEIQNVLPSAEHDHLNKGNANVARKPLIKPKDLIHGNAPFAPPAAHQFKIIMPKPLNKMPVVSNNSESPEMLLDVNTASNYLLISDDLKSVSRSHRYLFRPETSERFQSPQVLSTRGISSGKHELEMEVSKTEKGSGDYLFIGMCYPSIDRRGFPALSGDNVWGLQYVGFQYKINQNDRLQLSRKATSERIKIELDYKAGKLSFYELCDPIQHLYTFTATFTQPLHLIVSVQGSGCVKILKYT